MNQSSYAVDFSRNVVCLLGLPFDVVTADWAVARVRKAAREGQPLLLSTVNVNFVIAAHKDEAFRHSVIHSQMSLADGMPIVWISRLLGLPLPERVAGSGLFERLCNGSGEAPLRVYLFGAPDGVAQAASERINQRQGGVRCVGFESPGFKPVEELSGESYLERINLAKPDFVVVALGAQKGQAWIERNRKALHAPVISHLGAVIGFAAGALRRAPRAFQDLGLEWLWRVKEEPKLWRRYAGDALAFARIFFAYVLPLWWQRVWAAGRPQSVATVTGGMSPGGWYEIRLGTVCGLQQLPAFQACLAEAAQGHCKVVVDLTVTEQVDAWALGRLLLLYGHQRDIEQPLILEGPDENVRRQFRRHGVEFLLQRDKPHTAPAHASGVEAL